MANLTNRQRGLLRLGNQLTRNLFDTNAGLNHNVSVDLPGIDFDAGFSADFGTDNGTGAPADPTAPETLRDVLLELQNEQVTITTAFGPVTGTVISVQNDYVVLVETGGAQVLVPMESIELVSE
ncbi:DUF2642 domain-containing protein [Lentibacillus sp.]|uniref:DUF2642 domain-containing protein n=1 Tax=Lentibacillus sp. TaxID=1925746 RepID=UPI002B4B17AF|nr:DUF2642 domain-containing protein [Lentibacillus sp.]HLS09557.1 DUF2642 domain-containing protein [Lentibacillus sp.]